MDPKKTKNNSDTNKTDLENRQAWENSESEKDNSEGREPEGKNKKKWDDREIDLDQLIF